VYNSASQYSFAVFFNSCCKNVVDLTIHRLFYLGFLANHHQGGFNIKEINVFFLPFSSLMFMGALLHVCISVIITFPPNDDKDLSLKEDSLFLLNIACFVTGLVWSTVLPCIQTLKFVRASKHLKRQWSESAKQVPSVGKDQNVVKFVWERRGKPLTGSGCWKRN